VSEALISFLKGARPTDYRQYLRAEGVDLVAEERGTPGTQIVVTSAKVISAACRFVELEWDSTFFGRRTARVDGIFLSERAEGDLVAQLVREARARDTEFLLCRIDGGELRLAQALERAAFRLTDVLVLYRRELAKAAKQTKSNPNLDDVRAFLERTVSTMDHFRVLQDQNIPVEQARRFYLETSLHHLRNGAQATVLMDQGRILGVAIGVVDENTSRQIGRRFGYLWLIIMDPALRGRGHSRALFRAFCDNFADRCDTVEIGTQVGNAAANRLYLGNGCRPVAHALTFHCWPKQDFAA